MYDDEFDEDEFDDVLTCRECGGDIHSEAVSCPHCGWFVVEDHRPFASKPSWLRWLGIALILLMVLIMAGPVFKFLAFLLQ